MLISKTNGYAEAFTSAAGLSPSDLSLFIRMILLAGFFIWSAWCVLEIMKFYKTHPSESIASLLKDYTRIFLLLSILISLTFIA